jgi:GNAT superfamily N-acetyltransferase
VAPAPLLTCSHCGGTSGLRSFTFAESAGRLWITFTKSPMSEPTWKCLCDECWPKWLLWKARLGFDIHTHSSAVACSSACLAMAGGRRAQRLAMRSAIAPHETFWLQKAIDGMPDVNGSSQLAAKRLSKFLHPDVFGQELYESLPNAEEFKRQLLASAELTATYIPIHAVDHFIIVVEVFKSAHAAPEGVIVFPVTGEQSLGMHSVFVTGYEQAGEVIRFANSWGVGWGKAGHGSVSMDYLRRYLHESWAGRPARWGPTLSKRDRLLALPMTSREFRDLWMVRNPVWQQPLPRRTEGNWHVALFEAFSPSLGCPVECIQIANGYGLTMGWAFVYHAPEGALTTEIRELFVMPAFRRLGIGGQLEKFACDRGREWRSERMVLFFNEADATVGPTRAAARLFGRACGYEWRWRQSVGPRLVARGQKDL